MKSWVFYFILIGFCTEKSWAAQYYDPSPTSETQWNTLVQQLPDKHYQVQKGDTLWNISKIFFGDPYFWPKLWSLNRDFLFNPHVIYPKDIIVFDVGSFERPPSVRIIREEVKGDSYTKSDETISSSKKSSLSNSQESSLIEVTSSSQKLEPTIVSPINEYLKNDRRYSPEIIDLSNFSDIQVTATENRSFPPPESIPESLPSWGRSLENQSPVILLQPRNLSQPEQKFYVDCWVGVDTVNILGQLVEVEGDYLGAHAGQFVFIKGENFEENKYYTILIKTPMTKINKMKNKFFIFQYAGRIQVLESIGSKGKLYRAVVIEARYPLVRGMMVSSDERLSITLDLSRPMKITPDFELVANIYSGYCDPRRKIFNLFDVIFFEIFKGEVVVGDQISLFKNISPQLQKKLKIEKSSKFVGVAEVIKVEQNWATAILKAMNEEIESGDVSHFDLNLFKVYKR